MCDITSYDGSMPTFQENLLPESLGQMMTITMMTMVMQVLLIEESDLKLPVHKNSIAL
jgi:hypothetical protein